MTKENFLFGVIGLLAGLIIGFMATNSLNRSSVQAIPGSTMSQNSNIPAGHPEVGGAPDGSLPGQTGGSVPEVQAAIDRAKQEPNNFEAQVKAAELYYQIGRYDSAVEYLKKANKLRPDDVEMIINLGNATFEGKNYEEAEKWYAAALAKKPDNLNVRTDMGLTFIFRTPPIYDRAIQEFQRVLEVDPKHPQALQNMTVAYTKKGDAAKAKATLARLEGVDSTNEAISKLREDIQNLEIK